MIYTHPTLPDGFGYDDETGQLVLIAGGFQPSPIRPTPIRPAPLNPPRVPNVPLRPPGGGGRSGGNSLGSRPPSGGSGFAPHVIKPEMVPMPFSPEPTYPLPPQFQPPPPDEAAQQPQTPTPEGEEAPTYQYLPRTQGIDSSSFDDTPPMKTQPARPGTLAYIAKSALTAGANLGSGIMSGQPEAIEGGIPFFHGEPITPATPETVNQQIFGGDGRVIPPNQFAKYAGAAAGAVATNPLGLVMPVGSLGAAVGSGLGSQAGGDLADRYLPASLKPYATFLGGMVGGGVGQGASNMLGSLKGGVNLVGTGVRSYEDNNTPQFQTNPLDRVFNRRQTEGVAAPEIKGNYQTAEPPPPAPAFHELPLHEQDTITKAGYYGDPMAYGSSVENNKFLPQNFSTPRHLREMAQAESERLADQWRQWQRLGYFNDSPGQGGSAGAAVTPRNQLDGSHPEYTFGPDTHDPVQYQADNYSTPSTPSMTPEAASAQMKGLTGIDRVVDSHGKLSDANYNAVQFNPNPDLSRPSITGTPHMTRLAGETPEDFVSRVSQNFNGAKHIQYIQQELGKLQPMVDEAKSARAMNNYMEDHLQSGKPDMTKPENMTRKNVSDFIRKLSDDQQNEHLTGEPYLKSDRMFPDAKPPLLSDIHPNDIAKLKTLRDSLPDNSPLNTSQQAVADSLGRYRNYFQKDDPMAHKYAMDRIATESNMTPEQIKSTLGDIQDKLGYHSGDPKDLAEYFYWAKKNIKTDGDGGTRGSLSAAATPPELINDYTPTTDLARQHFLTRDDPTAPIQMGGRQEYNMPPSQQAINKIMAERFANPDQMNRLHSRMSQDAITREMVKRYAALGVELPPNIKVPEAPKAQPPRPPRPPIDLTPPPMPLTKDEIATQNSDMLNRLNAKHSLPQMARDLGQPMSVVRQRLRSALNDHMGPMNDKDFQDFLKTWYQ